MSDNEEDKVWDRLLGPFYSFESGAQLLRITEDELRKQAEHLEVLLVVTADEVELLPSAQFYEGRVIEGLSEVLKVLSTGTDDPWAWGLWLTAKVALGDEPEASALDKLLSGRKDEVLLEATHDAWAWRQ
jgi:hypothetical protein